MRLHRFYVGGDIDLRHDFWLHNERLIHQWHNVLRFQSGQEVVLFDGVTHDKLYRVVSIDGQEAHLVHVTDFERKLPAQDVYLLWSLLKKDKNDWVLQKGTELGVGHFIPLLADRSEKRGFNADRAQKIVIEAAEQCGRSDIPSVRNPILVQTAVEEFKTKLELAVCEQAERNEASRILNQEKDRTPNSLLMIPGSENPVGILIGPEGGWSDAEKKFFVAEGIKHLNLHDFTLRAETAAIAAAAKLLK